MDSVKQLIAHLQSCGTIRKPKKEGGLGLLVFNPRNLDIALVERLCDEAGLMVRNNATPTMFDNKVIDPHIWVGPPSAGVTADEAVDALVSQLS